MNKRMKKKRKKQEIVPVVLDIDDTRITESLDKIEERLDRIAEKANRLTSTLEKCEESAG